MIGMRTALALVAAMIPALALAQNPPATAAAGVIGPPVRVLGPALFSSSEAMLNPSQVRAFPDGRVLVNDASRRRLLLFDSTMKLIKVVADSISTVGAGYGLSTGRLMAYRGDSSLLLDGGTLSMLVIDGQGNIVKVKAIPRTEHSTYLAGTITSYGYPGFDANGNLVYRIADPSLPISSALGGGLMVPQQPDSAPVLRMNLETRKLDTAARVKIQKRMQTVTQTPTGGFSIRSTTNPMPVQDDWAVTSDGSIALLRHRDYSVDWVRPDGRVESTPPMPFDWQRLTDDHKKAFVDSIRTQLENSRKLTITRYDSINHICFDMERTMGPEIPRETRAAFQAAAKVEAEARAAAVAAAPARGRAAGAPPPAARGTAAPPPAARGTATAAAPPPDAARGRAAGAGPAGAAAGAANTTPAPRPVGPPPFCPTAAYPPAAFNMTPVNVIEAKELPDYKPPFGASAMRADADGNLWIRVNQMKPVPGVYIYDVVNNKGELIDRIQLPVARSIIGYGPGNIVYTLVREQANVKVERVRWRE